MTHYKIEQRLPAVVRLRHKNRYVLEGWIFGLARIEELSVTIRHETFVSPHIELYRTDLAEAYGHEPGYTPFCGFRIPVILSPVVAVQSYDVTLTARFRDGTVFCQTIGTIEFLPPLRASRLPAAFDDFSIVICMTTFNPSIAHFQRQIQSIVEQDRTDWICIIADDHSEPRRIEQMKAVTSQDARFIFREHPDNVGFYANFERCLSLVPQSARYVALSDHDDVWYPYKLSRLLERIESANCLLVYSDMRIVHSEEGLLHETYWVNRKNYYRSDQLDLLTLANTVTGAASLFRRELLDLALPFPQKCGVMFHDQWLAMIAAANGTIDYIDEPLYDYIQHSHNIIGHSDFHMGPPQSRLDMMRKQLAKLAEHVSAPRMTLLKAYKFFLYFYHFMYEEGQHIIALAETAIHRTHDPARRALIARALSVRGLLHIRRKVKRDRETLGSIDVFLLRSMLLRRFVRTFVIPNRPILRRFMIGMTHSLLHRLRKKGIFVPDTADAGEPVPTSSLPATAPPHLLPAREGINLWGYARAETGVGESCRLAANALQAAGIPFGIVNFEGADGARTSDLSWAHKEMPFPFYDINWFHINAAELPELTPLYGRNVFKASYNIGCWMWELPDFPDEWLDRFQYVDEIWAPSTFVAETIAKKSPVPVVRIPHSIEVKIDEPRSRAYFGLPEQTYLFLTMYDVRSITERKNPQGAVQAFLHAFGPDNAGVGLVVKVNKYNLASNELEELRQLQANCRNLYVIEDTLSRNDVNALHGVIDSFVSLHRSEGFGLGLAEAMCLGKPVIGTNWSAVTDFMNETNACPVDYKLVPLGRDYGPYKAYQQWAEPDIAHASRYMQRLVSDPAYGYAIGAEAEKYIRSFHSPHAVGEMIRRQIERIKELRTGREKE